MISTHLISFGGEKDLMLRIDWVALSARLLSLANASQLLDAAKMISERNFCHHYHQDDGQLNISELRGLLLLLTLLSSLFIKKDGHRTEFGNNKNVDYRFYLWELFSISTIFIVDIWFHLRIFTLSLSKFHNSFCRYTLNTVY